MSAEWPLKRLELQVLDLDREADFYRGLGLAPLRRTASSVSFGAGSQARLTLRKLPGGQPRPHGTAGLCHFALLLPSRSDLARFARFGINELQFTDASDHLVSEALYFDDPEGNGIEVYADRPRASWTWSGGHVRMDSIRLDVERLAGNADGEWSGFPASTRLGHMHLSVADLDRSQAWYERIGLALTASIPGARFMSWDGYHHHIGLNVWAGRDARPMLDSCAGLAGFVISGQKTDVSGQDPDGVRIIADPPGISGSGGLKTRVAVR